MIAIKEMNIPNRCAKCKFCLRQGTYGKCLLQKNKRVSWLAWNRDDNCPLVEVVTCKDCKYNDENVCMIDDCNIEAIVNDCFCACASRKDKELGIEYNE